MKQLAVLAILLAGCTTVQPKQVNAQFGVPVVVNADHSITVDSAGLLRYNSLAVVYGDHRLPNGAPVFIPAVKVNDGVTDLGNGLYRIDYDHAVDWGIMASLERQGIKP